MYSKLVEQSYDFLNNMAYRYASSHMPLCNHVLKNSDFKQCTGARKKHQAYQGGLVVHEAEVLDFALRIANAPSMNVNNELIVVGVIWHDFGKIYDYTTVDNEYQYTEHQKLIRHLPRSYADFMMVAKNLGYDESFKTQVGHIILSHHGRQEWGSPVEPITKEAQIVHFADMLSANASEDNYERLA